jgi:hypothetical protein
MFPLYILYNDAHHNVVVSVPMKTKFKNRIYCKSAMPLFNRHHAFTRFNIATCFFLSLQADVLVNSALPNLKHPTACGKALQDRGGISYIEACKLHTNIPALDIVCTSGGNLPCQYVIHAVCCNWNKNEEKKSEKVNNFFQ